jgi:hypothetical protein
MSEEEETMDQIPLRRAAGCAYILTGIAWLLMAILCL